MASTSVLSQTLRAITATKINELEKQRAAFQRRKADTLSSAAEHSDQRARVFNLIEGFQAFSGLEGYDLKHDLDHCQKWLDQSTYDASIPEDKLSQLETRLKLHLDRNGRKLDLAHLYSRLLTEWIEAPADPTEPEADKAEMGDDDSFEVLQNTQKERLDQLRDKFAKVVFTPLETDEVEIDKYLRGLFAFKDGDTTLERLRQDVHHHGMEMFNDYFRLDDQSLRWCIRALLNVELLNEEKKATLREFLKDDAVLAEIRDVLNMRFRDIETWDWDLGDKGMPVQPRQSLNGKWRVMMDDDVLQAILTHWIGTEWAVYLKGVFRNYGRRTGLLDRTKHGLSESDNARLRYYLHDWNGWGYKSLREERLDIYEQDFFLSPIPGKRFEQAGGYDDDDDVQDQDPDKKSAKDIKQLLLRTMATEVILRRSLDGEVAVVQSDFQWFATSMAHSTIFAVMRFMNVPEQWIAFFKKALSPPMDMLDGSPVRIRKRGLPMAHIFEKLFGEMVLFFLDVAVAQSTDMILYRYHDDLYLAGHPAKVTKAWQTMESFSKVMGLDFNQSKTGSVYLTDGSKARDPSIEKVLPPGPVGMNFLLLDPQSGQWIINHEHVNQHVRQLQKQLDGSKSVLQWIKTYNSCMSRFFKYTFGEPAHCFGSAHLNAIPETHRDMQRQLFNNEDTGLTAAQHLRHKISTKFSLPLEEIPESWLCAPESLGGLGLTNPFPSLLLLREHICKNPAARMEQFYKDEQNEYERQKRLFHMPIESERRKHYNSIFKDVENPSLSWAEAQTFISFEEYKRFRESSSSLLRQVYSYFLGQPAQSRVLRTQRLQEALRKLDKEDEETVWGLQYFEEEMFELFGGLEVVDKRLLPLGVLKALREGRVTWQMVL